MKLPVYEDWEDHFSGLLQPKASIRPSKWRVVGCRAYNKMVEWIMIIKGLSFTPLESGDSRRLEDPFSEEEVFLALTSLCGALPPGTFERSLNVTFIALILDKEGSKDLKDFRLINLMGYLYKISAKGREILDAILIANEVKYSRLKSLASGVLCKLDIKGL
ncbi:hypothetical protein CK203_031494 [Vitis vinifera]|uniref:Uncharacterized protein n=1 Tax=Vitis vinifera TaxID=29760 RepID=A0A438I8M8_VITVI|nr:hypothetical protein CK203_031494 [Vitis vinifera]